MAQHKRPEVARRMARIHGHVHAIKRMLDEGRSYSDVVHQVTAVSSSLDSVIQVIVDDLIQDCSAKAARKEPLGESLTELQLVVARIR